MPVPPNSALSTANAHVGKAAFVTGMAENLAEGHYAAAAQSAAMKVAFTPKVYEAAANLTKAVEPVASALGWVGRNLPIVGGVVLAVYDAKEVIDDIRHGEYKKALVAGVAGVAEVAATTALGGLAGAGARTLIVEGVAAAGGPRVNDAGLVAVAKEAVHLGVKGYEAGSRYVAGLSHDPAKIAAEQAHVLHDGGVLPATVKMGGHDVKLEVALRDPVFNRSFRENLKAAESHGHLDSKPLIAKIDQFDALERNRVSAGGDHHPAQPAQTAAAPARPATSHG